MCQEGENMFCFDPVGPPVSFRCMIQDILGNEVYTKHNSNNFGDRTIFYCITIPGENDWVRNCPKGNKNDFMTNTTSQIANSSKYREVNQETNKSATNTGTNSNKDNQSSNTEEENEREDIRNRLCFSLVNWSYPIPSNGKNKSCLIKVYDINLAESLRVNDIVHVIGLVEPVEFEDDAQLQTNKTSPSNGSGDKASQTANVNGNTLSYDNDFEPAADFPHNLVPRVHVQTLKKLNHINPLLPDIITRDKLDINMIKLARARLSTFLTELLGGDSLAAEYLILSLISRIHRRKDATTLGQLTIGLSGVKPEMKFLIEKIYEIIGKITTHSHFIDMSIANLNNLRFTPKKDHDNNKMIAGTLQLPDGLYLVLNETALCEGQLTAQGTANLGTLNQIIRWQRHNYDFKFHSVEIDTDLKVLVISEGKSILSVPYTVRLEKNDPDTINSIRQACDSVNDFLNEDLLNMFRYFITALKDVPEYTIADDTQKLIQDDFVNWRKEIDETGKVLFSADDLSSYITLARYLAISRGEILLTNDIWKDTCQMETARQSRLL